MSETQNEEAQDNQQVADAGIPGQIQYPDRYVDAERAGQFVAGDVETLYEEGDEPDGYVAGPNPIYHQDLEAPDDQETEPTENPDYDPNNPEHGGV